MNSPNFETKIGKHDRVRCVQETELRNKVFYIDPKSNIVRLPGIIWSIFIVQDNVRLTCLLNIKTISPVELPDELIQVRP